MNDDEENGGNHEMGREKRPEKTKHSARFTGVSRLGLPSSSNKFKIVPKRKRFNSGNLGDGGNAAHDQVHDTFSSGKGFVILSFIFK